MGVTPSEPRALRVLFVSDTHVGFDLPARPRVDRRRRGPDFLACFARALEPALRGEADVVVHGGDLLYRSRVPASLVSIALAPLLRVADSGVPVLLVPGNHERGALPYPLLAAHEQLHVFRRPSTVVIERRGLRVAFAGFPYARGVRRAFPELLLATGYRREEADARVLCLHQCVEGATCGPPPGFTFNLFAVAARRGLRLSNVTRQRIQHHRNVLESAAGDLQVRRELLDLVGADGIDLPLLRSFYGQGLLTAPRVYYAMANDGVFFNSVAAVHPATQVPVVAIVLQGALATMIALSGRYDQVLSYVVAIDAVFFGLTAAALFVFRRRDLEAGVDEVVAFRVPGHPFTTAAFVAAFWVLVINTVYRFPRNAGAGLLLLAAGVPVFYAWRRFGGARS